MGVFVCKKSTKGHIGEMKKYEWYKAADGTRHRRQKDIQRLTNLNYLKYTGTTKLTDIYEMPQLICKTSVFPDFLALYSEKSLYRKTKRTAVCFFEFDNVIARQDSLMNAIYYNNKKELERYKKLFEGVTFFLMKDASLFGDVDIIENLRRIRDSRIEAIWLTEELKAQVIPLISYPTLEYMPVVLSGLEECRVVAFSTKGYITDPIERGILEKAIKITVDTLNLDAIVIYDTCGDDKKPLDLFKYASQKGIKIIIPPNTLKDRNRLKMEENNA